MTNELFYKNGIIEFRGKKYRTTPDGNWLIWGNNNKWQKCTPDEVREFPDEVKAQGEIALKEALKNEREKVKSNTKAKKEESKQDPKNKVKDSEEDMPWLKYFEEGKRFKVSWLADDILDNHLRLFFDGLYLYRYDQGVYKRDGEQLLRIIIQDLLGERALKKYAEETIYYIENATFISDATQINPKGFINMKNGILNWRTGELIPSSPEFIFTYQIQAEYNPKANEAIIHNFVSSILPKDSHELFYEMIGYFFTNELRLEKAFMLIGIGRNGKSIAIDMICSLFGEDSYSTVSLQELSHRFRAAEIDGKLLNVYRDLPQKPIDDTGAFKQIVSNEELLLERKNKNPKKVKPECKLLFSSNHLVASPDMSDGYFRRWVLFEFKNEFNESNRDIDILEKLTTKDSLSTLFNLALEGLKRLHKNRKFSDSASSNELREKYRKHCDSVLQFVEEECELGEDHCTPMKELFNKYEEFCDEWRIKNKLGKKNFNVRIQERFKLSHKYKILNKVSTDCWIGIKIKDNHVEQLPWEMT